MRTAWNAIGAASLAAWIVVSLIALGIDVGAALIAVLGVVSIALLVIALWPSRTTKGDH